MKFKLGTRFLSVFLALVLVFQLLPVSIFATEGTTDETAPKMTTSNDACGSHLYHRRLYPPRMRLR